MTVLAHVDGFEHGLVVAVACVALVGYAWVWGGRPHRRRVDLLWWVVGTGAMVAATSPAMERLAESGFADHMVQHMVIVVVAAPAIVLAHPLRQVAAPHPPRLRRPVALIRCWGWILAPSVALVVLYGTHLTGLYDAALSNRLLHDAEHVAYLGAGMAVWWAVNGIGGSARPQRLAAVLSLMASMAMLGMILSTAHAPLYPFYEAALGPETALEDQRTGAAIMWIAGMVLTLPLLMVAAWRWASFEERVQKTRETIEASDGGGIPGRGDRPRVQRNSPPVS